MKHVKRKPIDNAFLKNQLSERHFERLGTRNPTCSRCGECDPICLTGAQPEIACYECQAQSNGKPVIENHHPSGQHNDAFTIPIQGNEHRILSESQKFWPDETFYNPNKSPLRKASASLRGFLDILRLIIERSLGWIPEFLETLDQALIKRLGKNWWKDIQKGDQ